MHALAHVYSQREEKKNETNITKYFTLLVMIFTTLLPVYTTVKCNIMSS